MTEEEWLTVARPGPLLNFLEGRADPRKMRLYACGCCRLVWPQLTDRRSRKAVAKLELFADDLGWDQVRKDAYNIANAAYLDLARADSPARHAACAVVCAAWPDGIPGNLSGNLWAALRPGPDADDSAARRAEADVIRDVFGNPFRLVAGEPGWRTETVVALARGAYADRAWDRLPVLADALDDAGCTNADLLGHLRDPALTHVRGCWAVDLILGLS